MFKCRFGSLAPRKGLGLKEEPPPQHSYRFQEASATFYNVKDQALHSVQSMCQKAQEMADELYLVSLLQGAQL